jgi:hypothetical protein
MDDKNKGGQQEANRSEDMQKKPSQGTDANRETQGSGNQGNQASNQSGSQTREAGNQPDQNRQSDQQKRPA